MAGHNSDGSIVIDTKIDTSGFDRGSTQLHKASDNLSKGFDNVGKRAKAALDSYKKALDSGKVRDMQKFQENLEKAAEAAQTFKDKLNGMKGQTFSTDAFKALLDEIVKTDHALQRLLDREAKMKATGVKQNSRAYQSLQYDIQQTRDRLKELQADYAAMSQNADEVFDGADTAQFEQYSEAIERLEEQLRQMKEEADNAFTPPHVERWNNMVTLSGMIRNAFTSAFNTIKSAAGTVGLVVTHPIQALDRLLGSLVSKATHAAGALLGMVRNAIAAGLRRIADAAKSAVKSIGQLVAAPIVNGFRRLGSAVKNAAKNLITLGSSSKKANRGLKGGFMTILKYGLGIRSLYALVNKLRSAIKEGFGNLVQYSDKVNASISGVMSAGAKFKNQIAATFAPLVNIAAPILTNFINLVTSATEKLGQLVALMSGQKTFLKAKDVQKDYAASLDKTTKSAKEAERQLSSFDQLEILKDNKSGDKNEQDPSSMFEEVPITDEIQSLGDKIKAAFEIGDLSDIGGMIGDRLKAALDSIPWPAIREKARSVGTMLATLLNGVLETPGLFNSLGKTVAEGINTAFSFLDGFAWSFHWDSLGNAILDAVEGFCDNLDWTLINHALQGIARGLADLINSIFARREVFEKVGETLGRTINTVITAGLDFFDRVDFQQIGSTLAAGLNSMIKTVDWNGAGKLLAGYLNSLVNLVYGAVTTFDWRGAASALADGINGFIKNTDWKKIGQTIGETVKGLLSFLAELIEDIDWYQLGHSIIDCLRNIDWNGIVDAAFELLGAALGGLAAFLWGLIEDAWNSVVEWWHDVAYEDGEFTIAGLLEGIWNALKNIGQWIYDHIFKPIWDGICKAFRIGSPSKAMAEIGDFIIQGLLGGMLDGIKGIVKWLDKNIAKPITKFFKDPLGTIKLAVDNTWEATQKLWESVKDSEVVKTISGAITRTFETAKSTFESLKSSPVVKTIAGFVERSFDEAKTTFEAFRDGDVWKHIKGKIERDFETAKGVFDAFVDGDVWKHVQGKIEKAYNTAKDIFDAFKDTDVYKHIQGKVERAYETAKGVFDAFVDGDVWKHIQGKVERAYDTAKGVFDAFVDGDVWKHIQGKVERAYDTAKATFDAFVNGDVFKIVKGNIDKTFESAKTEFVNFKDSAIVKTITATIEKGSKWVEDAWTVVSSAGSTAVTTIKAALTQAATSGYQWVADAWTAVKSGGQTLTATVKTALQQVATSGYNWVSDAWTAIKNAGATTTTTIKAAVQQAATSGTNWVANAWTALSTAGSSVTTTVKTALQQAATSGSNWVADAFTAIKTAGQTTTTTIKAAVQKYSTSGTYWNTEAAAALAAVGNTAITYVQTALSKASSWATAAYDVIAAAGKSMSAYITASLSKSSDSTTTTLYNLINGNSVISKTVQITLSWVNNAVDSVKKWLGIKEEGGIFTIGGGWRNIPQFANGGRIMRNGAANWWNSVRKYAAGTARAHGSLFVAGEAGPEVVGHVNGRTEVLNRSQIASAIYSAVLAGMEVAVNGLATYLGQRMADCANAIISGTFAAVRISGTLPVKVIGADATLIKQLAALTGSVNYTVPAYSTGTVMPYEVAAMVERAAAKIEGAIDNQTEELSQTVISALASLSATLVSALQQYGGGGQATDTSGIVQQTIDEINIRTRMFNASPLIG